MSVIVRFSEMEAENADEATLSAGSLADDEARARLDAMRDRLTQLNEALFVLRSLFPSSAELLGFAGALRSVENTLTQAKSAPTSEPPSIADLVALEEELERTEESIMLKSAQLPTGTVREQLEQANVSDEALLSYMTLLRAHSGVAQGFDRFELMAMCLLRDRRREGQLRPMVEAVGLLERVLPPVLTEVETRQKAVDYFHDARLQVANLEDVNAVFESGLYKNAEGYKISLRTHYFDPMVFYASAEFNAALSARLREFVGKAGMSEAEIAARFAEVRDQVRSIFQEEFSRSEVSFRSPPRRRLAEETTERATPQTWNGARSDGRTIRGTVIRAVLALSVIVSVYASMQLWRTHRQDLSPLSSAKVAQLSPLLASGSYGGAKNGRVFVGEVISEKWSGLGREQRANAVSDLWKALDATECRSMALYRDDVLVGHVVDGNTLLLVE